MATATRRPRQPFLPALSVEVDDLVMSTEDLCGRLEGVTLPPEVDARLRELIEQAHDSIRQAAKLLESYAR